MRTTTLAFWFVSIISHAQEIPIVGPSFAVQPGAYVVLSVSTLTDSDLAATTVTVQPKESTTLIPAKAWGGGPMVLFSAGRPGKYVVEVTLNKWRQSTDAGLVEAKAAAIEAELLTEYEALSKRLAARYPLRFGACVVEVAGYVPPPVPPTPPIPPTPTPGKRQVVILYESADETLEQARMLIQLRSGVHAKYLKDNGHALLILDDDLPEAAKWAALVPSARPALIITDAASSAVVYSGENPKTAEDLIMLLKKHGG